MMIWATGDMDIWFQTNGNFLVWGSHAMDQWTQGATQNLLELLGIMNATMDFTSLPVDLQLQEVATIVNFTLGKAGGR